MPGRGEIARDLVGRSIVNQDLNIYLRHLKALKPAFGYQKKIKTFFFFNRYFWVA